MSPNFSTVRSDEWLAVTTKVSGVLLNLGVFYGIMEDKAEPEESKRYLSDALQL